jgi:hypothetical protein
MPYGDAMTDTRQETCPRCGSKYRDNPACIADHDETFACYECDAPWHTPPPPAPSSYFASNVEHISPGLIDRRFIYRTIERMAGMTVPQVDYDYMGDPVFRPAPKPEEIYAHVLKAIAEAPVGALSPKAEVGEKTPKCVTYGCLGRCPVCVKKSAEAKGGVA